MLIDYRTRLEMLNLSHNRLNTIQGVSSLQSLIALNLGEHACGISKLVYGFETILAIDRC